MPVFFVLGFLTAMCEMDALSEVFAALAMLANMMAFLLALGCWFKGSNKIPWIVLSISGIGLCYCVFFGLQLLGFVL